MHRRSCTKTARSRNAKLVLNLAKYYLLNGKEAKVVAEKYGMTNSWMRVNEIGKAYEKTRRKRINIYDVGW
jgi:hypothetical protein